MGSESRNEKQDDLKLKQKECLSQAFCGMKWMQYSGLAKQAYPQHTDQCLTNLLPSLVLAMETFV